MNRKAITITSAAMWGGCILTVGLINLASRSYGRDFLKLIGSIYPGFRNKRTLTDVLVGTAYATLDGAVSGYVFGSLYQAIDGAAREGGRPSLISETPRVQLAR